MMGKNYGRLVKKVITDKNGHRKTVWVLAGKEDKDVKRISPKEPRKMDEKLSDLPKYLAKKVKRGEEGEGKEIKLKKVEIREILTNGKVGIISAGVNPKDPEDMKLSKKEVAARDKKLKSDLIKMGLKFTPAIGKYGRVENSYMVFVPEIERREVDELGTKYNQDSVIYSDHGNNEVIYTTGENKGLRNVGKGFKVEKDSIKDYFTLIKTPSGNMKFNLDIDWDNFVKSLLKLFRK